MYVQYGTSSLKLLLKGELCKEYRSGLLLIGEGTNVADVVMRTVLNSLVTKFSLYLVQRGF